MAIQSETTIADTITNYLETQFPFIDTTTGRPLTSLLLNAVASEVATAYAALSQVQIDQGVSDPTAASPDELQGVAYNWNVSQKSAIASTGVATFQKVTQPTTTIQIGASDGTGGVIVSTSRQLTGTVVSFVTTETVFLTPTTAQNPSTGFYEVDAAIQCLTIGTAGNIDSGLITTLQSSVSGIDYVTNKISSTGGRDTEDSTSLAKRTIAKAQGQQPGIRNGMISTALAQSRVTDAIVVGPNDPEFTRNGVAGAVDLMVLGEQITSAVQYATYTTNQPFIALQNRPATDISSVVATVGLTTTILIPFIDYQFSQDTAGSNAYSASSDDKLLWLNGQHPNNNTQVTVTYQYDKSIGAIQSVLTESDTQFVTANVLAKRAIQIIINIALTVRKKSGYTPAVVSSNVAAAISNYVNNLGLGQSVTQSALTVAITDATGVSSVVLPFTQLYIRGNTPTVSDIAPTKYQYARVDATSLTITVV